AAWCTSCRDFNTQTLPSPEVQAFADRFCWVRIDIDRDMTIARAHNVRATPTFELIDADGKTRVRFQGVRTPKEFCHELDRFLESLEPGAAPLVPEPLDASAADGRT